MTGGNDGDDDADDAEDDGDVYANAQHQTQSAASPAFIRGPATSPYGVTGEGKIESADEARDRATPPTPTPQHRCNIFGTIFTFGGQFESKTFKRKQSVAEPEPNETGTAWELEAEACQNKNRASWSLRQWGPT